MKDSIIKYRLPIVITALIITFLSLLVFPRLKVNANVDDYVPDSVKNKVYLKKLDSIFGGSEMILVMLQNDNVVNYKTLKRLYNIAEDVKLLEGIDRSISPFDAQEIAIEDGLMVMEPFLSDLSERTFESKVVMDYLESNRMASSFFSKDRSLVSIVLTKNTKTPDTVIDVFFSFREWRGVFMPFVIVVMSIILAFGVMAAFGWEISLFSILMPIMIIAIANDYGIHLIARYQELSRNSWVY